ncbi:MAG TPA: hypothetical protein VG842_02070 [Sediminibacterium sp.]|nr:hypothetical protein [Sediminibacterium sp.]
MYMEVLVFATNVNTPQEIELLRPLLDLLPGINRWNFDLDDCDRVLRIEGPVDLANTVRETLYEKGFVCSELA